MIWCGVWVMMAPAPEFVQNIFHSRWAWEAAKLLLEAGLGIIIVWIPTKMRLLPSFVLVIAGFVSDINAKPKAKSKWWLDRIFLENEISKMQNVHCLQVILMLTPKPGTGRMSHTTCPCSLPTPSARSVTSLWSSLLALFIKCHYRQGCGQPAQLPEDQQERECDGGGDSPPPLQGEEPGQIHGQYRQYSYSSCVVCTLRARLLANQTALKRQNLQVVTKNN